MTNDKNHIIAINVIKLMAEANSGLAVWQIQVKVEAQITITYKQVPIADED